MKALSIRQPWAELIMRGLKDVENRSWRTHHRGPLLIHASQSADEAWYEDFGVPDDAARGALLGFVNVVASTLRRTSPWHQSGSWGFYVENPRRFPRPIPWSGSLGLFEVPARNVSKALAAARLERQRPLDILLAPAAPQPKTLTVFSWGYEGWGNATRQLVRSFDLAEAYRQHAPPIFVDIRMSRSVRAVGFRDHAFEELLGHARYRWFRSLGNPNIVRGARRKQRVQCPDAVHQLIDLAVDAARERRRVIFFCSCGCPIEKGACHRFDVAKLVRRVAARRGIELRLCEWPGGEPSRWPLPIKVTGSMFEAVRRGQKRLDLASRPNLGRLASLPWGALVEVQSGRRRQLVSTGPAQFARGRWALPLFLSVDENRSRRDLARKAKRRRRLHGLE